MYFKKVILATRAFVQGNTDTHFDARVTENSFAEDKYTAS